MESYSKKIKASILENEPKKNCCRRLREDVMKLGGDISAEQRAQRISRLSDFIRCPACFGQAAGALFSEFGSVTDPGKQYHLDFSFDTQKERDAAGKFLLSGGIEAAPGVRKGRYILYIKDSGRIEDFLALTGASSAAFELMNSKIVRELREDANRLLNCDMANIKKAISASEKMLGMLNDMEKSGALKRLPAPLAQTAALRRENMQASMTELGQLHNPPISKSGVKHRLDKIIQLYEKEN